MRLKNSFDSDGGISHIERFIYNSKTHSGSGYEIFWHIAAVELWQWLWAQLNFGTCYELGWILALAMSSVGPYDSRGRGPTGPRDKMLEKSKYT